ncbi:MAG: glutaredoxin family protein [Pyrinomonadaceae bacterium]
MGKVQVILYTRPGCHLCDEARQAIAAAGCAESYTLTEVNIEMGPVLLDLYKNDIPVITMDGVQAFKHRVDSDAFRQRVSAKGAGQPAHETASSGR